MSRISQSLSLSRGLTCGKFPFAGVLASAIVFLPCLAVESPGTATLPTHHLDFDKIHPESTSPIHSREEETIRISPYSYEVLFPDELRTTKASASSRIPWLTDPAQPTRNGFRLGGRSGASRAEFSVSDVPLQSGGLPLMSSGASSEFVRTVLVGAGYLVQTDPSYKYGLPVTPGAELGQHISLAGGSFTLGEIDFPYYSSVDQSQSLVFRLYSVGAGGLPSSLLYQSDPQDIHSGIYSVGITYAGPIVPKDLVFSIAFYGLSNGASVGLLLPNADPTIGSTTGQILAKEGGTWTQKTVQGGIKGAISISVSAASVPEPQTVLMVFIAGIALWAVRRNNS